ncbi:FAD-binding oxidoreductase [Streptomyces malaysiensis]|uniref:FAD-binding oxidoreductase n=1 Tax=Streptomyces malaysiensis TaxID=92644 RepID=UPI0033C7F09B
MTSSTDTETDLFQRLARIVGEEHLTSAPEEIEAGLDNTLGMKRTMVGIVRPGSVAEVQEVVHAANAHRQPLYPISRGMNVGNGTRLPSGDGQLLVDLSRLSRVRSVDIDHGYAEVEPGVTQLGLATRLEELGAPFFADMTGAATGASILGNALEGGLGYTERGNHRNTLSDLEVVLGTGTLLRTGTFPGVGPDLSGLFVQSNFGIVTCARVELVPMPEAYASIRVEVPHDQHLERFVDALVRLKVHGQLGCLTHISNPLRAIGAAKSRDSTAYRPPAAWSAYGALYGSRRQLTAQRRRITAALRPIGQVQYFTDASLSRRRRLAHTLDGLARLPLGPLRALTTRADAVRQFLENHQDIHDLMRGVPSDAAFDHISRDLGWERLGLIWCSPTVAADGAAVRDLVRTAEPVYREHGFAFSASFILATPDRIVGVLGLTFDKHRQDDVARAHQCYGHLVEALEGIGARPYRKNAIDTCRTRYADPGKAETLDLLKKALDPGGVIAPHRYGIGGPPS